MAVLSGDHATAQCHNCCDDNNTHDTPIPTYRFCKGRSRSVDSLIHRNLDFSNFSPSQSLLRSFSFPLLREGANTAMAGKDPPPKRGGVGSGGGTSSRGKDNVGVTAKAPPTISSSSSSNKMPTTKSKVGGAPPAVSGGNASASGRSVWDSGMLPHQMQPPRAASTTAKAPGDGGSAVRSTSAQSTASTRTLPEFRRPVGKAAPPIQGHERELFHELTEFESDIIELNQKIRSEAAQRVGPLDTVRPLARHGLVRPVLDLKVSSGGISVVPYHQTFVAGVQKMALVQVDKVLKEIGVTFPLMCGQPVSYQPDPELRHESAPAPTSSLPFYGDTRPARFGGIGFTDNNHRQLLEDLVNGTW